MSTHAYADMATARKWYAVYHDTFDGIKGRPSVFMEWLKKHPEYVPGWMTDADIAATIIAMEHVN